ncbi:MAG: ERF family protein [Bacilli bacterium]|nr:ERF family protein [Bacilli bacterium]
MEGKNTFTPKYNGEYMQLLKKMWEIMGQIECIGKNGKNNDYEYVMEKDVVLAVKAKLKEKNIMLIPSVLESTERNLPNSNVVKVTMSFTFFDLEGGGSITTYYQGEGEDPYDKGIYKAVTGCQKYALLKTFLIPTGDDPEYVEDIIPKEENKEFLEKVISDTKARQLYAIAKGDKPKLEQTLKKYGYTSTFEVKEKHLQLISSDLKS